MPSPQLAVVQSLGHELTDSCTLQIPSPQWLLEQSRGHEVGVSVEAQM